MVINLYSPFSWTYTFDMISSRVDSIIDTARDAQYSWALSSPSVRASFFRPLYSIILDHHTEIMDLIQEETHKNRRSAFDEVCDVALTAHYYSRRGAHFLKSTHPGSVFPFLFRSRVDFLPHGVVGIFVPWNYPFSLFFADAIAALIAGNAVIIKPSPLCEKTALYARSLLLRTGLPPELFQVLTHDGTDEVELGSWLIDQVDQVMFTGSTRTGRIIAAQAGNKLIPFTGELGGKNAMIIAQDADIDKAADSAIRACFSNSGQLCMSIERIYVDKSHYEVFLDSFIQKVSAMKIGAGKDWDIDMGGLINAEHRKHVENMVSDAMDKGARARIGGHGLDEHGDSFYAPTVLTDVPADALLYEQEVFGPVVYVEPVSSIVEAINKTNNNEHALHTSIWASRRFAYSIAKHVHTGTVSINDDYRSSWASLGAPMGGMKASGIGRRHGKEGLLSFTQSRSITRPLLPSTGQFRDYESVKKFLSVLSWARFWA